MKTMIDVKHVGSIKSIRHAGSPSATGTGLPHLHLYVHQMNLYKLKKEKKALLNRMGEIDKQIEHLEEKVQSMRPQIIAAFGMPPKQKKRSGANGKESSARKCRFNKMTINY